VPDYLVEDLHSLRAARNPDGELWSCSTGLPYLVEGRKVRSPEALLDATRYSELGRRLLDARPALRAALTRYEEDLPGIDYLAVANTQHIYNSYVLFAFKALTLAAWLRATNDGPPTVIGCRELKPVRRLSTQVGFHDHIFAALAGEMTEGPSVISVPAVEPGLFSDVFAHVPAFDRFFNIVNRTNAAIAFQLWCRMDKPFSLGGEKGSVLLLDPTEGIEECFLRLLRDGWRLIDCDDSLLPVSQTEPDCQVHATLGDDLEAVWRAAVATILPENLAVAGWRLLWPRISTSVSQHRDFLVQARARVEGWRRENGDKLKVALSSGLYGAPERLLDACLREQGVSVVCVDHGTSKGLAAWHDEGQEDYISFSDRYAAFNDETRILYDQYRRDDGQVIQTVGTPRIFDHQRFPRLQRLMARRRLKVGGDEPILMYVTSLAINNMPHGYGGGTDWDYAKAQRELIDALGRFPGRVVVKPYPVQRFADPEQIWQMPLPENVSLAPFGEFRQARWAADLLLLDISSSTISWAIATGLPLIYVDGTRAPLTERAAMAARAGLFLFDAREAGWQRDIETLLVRPLSEIQAEWEEKAVARKSFDQRFVLGKRGGFVAGVAAMLSTCEVQNGPTS
jgi:hypothetical protein